jgi:hypothetical protein
MKYFLFYAAGLAICWYVIDLESARFTYRVLAPVGSAIFAVLMFGWISYRSIVDFTGPDVAATPYGSVGGGAGCDGGVSKRFSKNRQFARAGGVTEGSLLAPLSRSLHRIYSVTRGRLRAGSCQSSYHRRIGRNRADSCRSSYHGRIAPE